MYTNILIPVAFEEGRDVDGAVTVARTLAATGAHITFLHVMEQMPVYATEFVPVDMMAQTKDKVGARLRELAETLEGARTAVTEGPSGRGITNWAEENGADCIIIASHRPVMSDLLLGSTAAWVVRHAQCAVHVIR
ncbi:universal stress protein [uncultured Tateyamaria sp.]|uniref:universal stress protein n=1 Tax=uncultured Tateyamaria sp. TaxID=455651 RepID=UPI0026075CF7|nr:universal stress protein [uncultured Tateyamaria sp.]